MKHDFLKYTKWKNRRIYLWAVTLFSMAFMVMSVFFAELELALTIVGTGFGSIVLFTMAYVFGAVADHWNARKVTKELQNEETV